MPGTSQVTYSSAEETTIAGSSVQYYTVVEYGTAATDANGFPTGLSAISGSTNVKIGGYASISGTGFVASAYFSPTTGSYQYYLHCDVKPAAAGNVYFTFIISNGTWTWVQYYETSISSTTSITEVYVTGPKTYWTSGNYVYACAATTPGGFNQVGTIQISSGTTSEGTSTTPSTTWYPLSPAPTNLDTQSWYSQRSTAAQVLTAGTAYLIALSGGSTYYVANPSLPSVTLALINLGASPTASINGSSISLGTTYCYDGSNLYLTISSPNSNTIYTINKFPITGTMSLETIGANNPNYYVGPAALPGGTWLSQATINPTALTHNVIYYPPSGVYMSTFSFSITVNGSYSFTSSQGSYGNGTFYLYFKPGDTESVKASAGPAFLPDAYSPVSISGNNTYILPYAAAAAYPISPSGSGIVWGPGGYIGPSLLTSLTGLSQVIINAPPPSTSTSINGLSLTIPSIGPFTLYLGATGSLTLTYGNNTLVSSNALDPPSPATPGYLMAPVSGNPPLYYLATKYGGITVIPPYLVAR